MADLIRMGGIVGITKDRMDTPSSGSEDEGGVGVDLADLAQELDQDEFDGPLLINGAYVEKKNVFSLWANVDINPIFFYQAIDQLL